MQRKASSLSQPGSHLAGVPDFAPLIHNASGGREKSSRWQKTICLLYISPWIRNLSHFQDPSHILYDRSDEKLRSAVRILIDITIRDLDVCLCYLKS
jgi:hypothetical protein